MVGAISAKLHLKGEVVTIEDLRDMTSRFACQRDS